MEENLSAVYSTDVFQQFGGWADGYSGVDIELDLGLPDGKRIQQIIRHDNGAALQDDDVLSIAGCSRPFDEEGTLCSYSGFGNVSPLVNPASGNAWSGAEFLIYALEQGINTQVEQNVAHISDANNTPLWPVGPFYQPLEGVGRTD